MVSTAGAAECSFGGMDRAQRIYKASETRFALCTMFGADPGTLQNRGWHVSLAEWHFGYYALPLTKQATHVGFPVKKPPFGQCVCVYVRWTGTGGGTQP